MRRFSVLLASAALGAALAASGPAWAQMRGGGGGGGHMMGGMGGHPMMSMGGVGHMPSFTGAPRGNFASPLGGRSLAVGNWGHGNWGHGWTGGNWGHGNWGHGWNGGNWGHSNWGHGWNGGNWGQGWHNAWWGHHHHFHNRFAFVPFFGGGGGGWGCGYPYWGNPYCGYGYPGYAYSYPDYGYGTSYYDNGYDYGYPATGSSGYYAAAPLVTGRSVATGQLGSYCTISVKTCELHHSSYVGGACSCRVPGGRARGLVTH